MPAGRPPFEITPEVCKKAEQLAAQGLAEYQIAAVLGISQETLIKKKQGFSEFSEAIKNGQAKGIAKVTNKLFEKAGDGDNTAMIFYLKNRDPENWKDRHDHNHGGQKDNPIEVKSVKEMSDKELERIIATGCNKGISEA